MIYKITDEQHFQVLSDSFSVSPSETGYELYFSANGVEFSPFTTVAAGQNKQFVNMANGNYYYLSGNVGDVEVNWEKDCGGGGGGGTAGVSSLDGQTGALTTKTINGNAILGTGDIVISGAGGDSNYVIVDALSAITNPVEGMIAYIPAHSETFTGLSIESSQVAYQAQLKKSAPRDIAYTISAAYSIGTDNNTSSSFYFDSGNWTPMYRKNVWLQYDDANQKTKIVCRDGYTIECFLSQEYYEAITTSFTVDEQVFIYKNNKWYPFEDGKISFYLNNVNTQAKWTDFINEINRLAPGSFQYVYDWYDFGWSTIKFNTLSKPQYSDGITLAYGTSYLFKSSNGETFDTLNAYSLRIDNSAGWKNIALATQAGVPIASDSTLGGIKVGSGLTIDANGVLSADGGGGASKTIVNIDALSQSELVDLYNTLSGATSADSINEHYEFYYTFYDSPYGLTEGPIRLQFLYPQGSCVTFGASCYDGQYQNIVAYSVRLNSDGTYDYYFDKIDKTAKLETAPIFRDYWYVYYDTTTSGFSYGVDQELTPITWGTGTTCSGEWIFSRDLMYQYLGSPIKSEKALYFNLRVKTAEGTRIYGYPSFSRVVLDTPVTFTNEQSESISFTDKVYFDYGDCVLSFYFENNWRFGGMQITFR